MDGTVSVSRVVMGFGVGGVELSTFTITVGENSKFSRSTLFFLHKTFHISSFDQDVNGTISL
jgi:hypothetical protein